VLLWSERKKTTEKNKKEKEYNKKKNRLSLADSNKTKFRLSVK